ncbi:MAG: Hpt domain-containing protein [Pseudomonadota bacterium]|nr:Hpt domain-containing protein [Pseudomonadota bacterium]
MSTEMEFDLGSLTWVKAELDNALQSAQQILVGWNGDDTTPLKSAAAHLHQVYGALQIVDLRGLSLLTAETERLISAMAEKAELRDGEAMETALRAISDIRSYLDGLMAGTPHVEMKLAQIYHDVMLRRGGVAPAPSELFYPDTQVRATRAEAELPMDDATRGRAIRRARFQYQKGLLQFLQNREATAGLMQMDEAVRAVERIAPGPAQYTFWWTAAGLMEQLRRNGAPSDFWLKRLCGRIDLQMRRMMEGSRQLAERLFRDVLYYVAQDTAPSGRAAETRELFQLARYLPPQAGNDQAAVYLPHLMALRDSLAGAKDHWMRYCAGRAESLEPFQNAALTLFESSTRLPNGALQSLARIIQAVAKRLPGAADATQNEALQLEMATGLLLAQNAVDHFEHLGPEFDRQSDTQAMRLQAAIDPMFDTSRIPRVDLLDEFTHAAQEKLVLAQVTQEIQANLNQAEDILDKFFRDPAQRGSLPMVPTLMKQIVGALNILQLDVAAELVNEATRRVAYFAESDAQIVPEDLDWVAEALSYLGIYMEALRYGRDDSKALRALLDRPMASGKREATVETELRGEAEQIVESVRQWADQGGQSEGRAALKAELTQLARDADLVADSDLRDKAAAAAQVLENATSLDQVREAVQNITPAAAGTPTTAPAPSADTLRLAAASDETIDRDILLTYIEEAQDVLGNIAIQTSRLHVSPYDKEAFTSIRRGFHTLKGSGRMVGLTDLAELAWEVEQTLNLWLRDERAPNGEILQLIEDTADAFHVWVMELEDQGQVRVEAGHLTQAARHLRDPGNAAMVPPPKSEAGAQAETAAAAGMAVAETAEHAQDGASVAVDTIAIGEHILPTELFRIFSSESSQRLADMAGVLGNLGHHQHPGAWETFLRSAHTLAGIARTTGFTPLADAAHALETWAGEWPEKTQALADEATGTLEAVIGQLTASVHGILEHRFPQPMPIIDELLAGLVFHVAGEAETEVDGDTALPTVNPIPEAADVAALVAATPSEPPAACRTLVVDSEKRPQRGQFLPDLPPHSPAMGQKAGEKWTAAVDLQPTIPKSDRLPAIPAPEPAVAPPLPAPVSPLDETTRDDLDSQLLPIFLEEASTLLPQIGSALRTWRSEPNNEPSRDALKRSLHTLKGSARMAGAMTLGEDVHALESVITDLGGTAADTALLDALEAAYDGIADKVQHYKGGGAKPTITPEATAQPDQTTMQPVARPELEAAARVDDELRLRHSLRQKSDILDTLLNEAGEVSIARARIENVLSGYKLSAQELSSNVERLRSQLREMEIQAETQMRSRLSQMEDESQFDPLEFDRFSRLQELTRLLAESVNDVSTVQENLFSGLTEAEGALVQQSRMTRNLQQELMHIRMVPMNTLAERLHRVARQSAKETRRRAHLEIDGGQTEIDRTVLDRIAAPLEHLVRNAVAHGIEDPQARAAAGKPEFGEVRLSARQEGNEIVLNLSDDGGGIDHAAVRARAIVIGWLAANAEASDEQLDALLFRPGFSTAAEVTELAGRGIGLDVVRNEIAGIGGRVRLETSPGTGTRFTIHLPLTLALSQVVLARAGGVTYALPANIIALVREVRAEQMAALHETGEVMLGDEIFPLRTLSEMVAQPMQAGEGRYRTILLLRSGEQRLAIRVDALQGTFEAVVKNIGPQLARIAGVSGATVLGDGRVALIINPFQLAERAPRVEIEVEIEEKERAPLVLVVDDSLTVRKITSRFLEREGFRVAIARDGVEALEALEDEIPVIMLLDIEMPRMDGFEVARHVRAGGVTRDLPIIMITSRTAEKHRNHARELGVNAYMGKPYQEEVLLEEINRLAGLTVAS